MLKFFALAADEKTGNAVGAYFLDPYNPAGPILVSYSALCLAARDDIAPEKFVTIKESDVAIRLSEIRDAKEKIEKDRRDALANNYTTFPKCAPF